MILLDDIVLAYSKVKEIVNKMQESPLDGNVTLHAINYK